MTWRDRPLVGFDTETTSPDPETARIVSACIGVAVPSAGTWAPRSWLLRQSEPIPAEATAIHGITTEHANEHGTPAAKAIAQIRDDLYRAWADDMPVVIYNAVYDLTVLDRECRRHDLGVLDVRGPVLDPLVIDKAVDRYRRGSRKLIDTARHYGVTLDENDAHGAEADAFASVRIAWNLAHRLDDLDAERLMAWQAEHYAEQRRSFAAYRARRGEPLTDTSTHWPMRPHQQEAA